jgi:hypothetical protein
MKTEDVAQKILDAAIDQSDEKIAMFFYNTFGLLTLEGWAIDLFKSKLDAGAIRIESDKDIKNLVNAMSKSLPGN